MSDKKATKKRWNKNKKTTNGPLDEPPSLIHDVKAGVKVSLSPTADVIPMADDGIEVEAKKNKSPQSPNGNIGSRSIYNSPLRSKSSGGFSSFVGPRSAMLQQPPPLPLPVDSPGTGSSDPMSKSATGNYTTVRAQIERSPTEPKVKSWPSSPEHKKVNGIGVDSDPGTGAYNKGVATSAVNGTPPKIDDKGGNDTVTTDHSSGERAAFFNNSKSLLEEEEKELEESAAEGGYYKNTSGQNGGGGGGSSKIPRRPSMNKSKSEEALAGTRVKKSPPSRLMADAGGGPKVLASDKDKGSSVAAGVVIQPVGRSSQLGHNKPCVVGADRGENRNNSSSSPRYYHQSPLGTPRDVRKSGDGGGDHSPGCQSVASISSQATVITNAAGQLPLDNISSNNKVIVGAQQKHTLGEILRHIEIKTQSLLSEEKGGDFTHATTLPDLTFLAHQSRYSADPHIRRRLMTRLAECRVVEIFVKVFTSVHTVDYLAMPEPFTFANPALSAKDGKQQQQPPGQQLSSSQGMKTSGAAAGQANRHAEVGGSPRQQMSDSLSDYYGASPRRPLDMMSEPGLDNRSLLSERLHNVPNSMKNLRAALTLLSNASEKSSSVCEQCLRLGIVPLLLEELGNDVFYGSEAMRDQNRMYLVKGYLGVLLNVIKHQQQEITRETYRDSGAVKVLQQYLKSSLLTVKTRTLILLSYVIGEAENDVINATERHLGLLVKMLQGALESEDHVSKKYGMHASELAAAVNRYASCESNKTKLVRRGVLPLFVQLMKPEASEEEKMLGAKGLWLLAFAEENRAVIQQDAECLQALETLEKSSHREEIRKTASGALWVIHEHHIPVRPVNAAFTNSETQNDLDFQQHVLISYQWGAKNLVFKLKERLRAAGYKVCTDVERTDMPIMDGMATSVAQAAVVLLCLTHRFKESPSCRTEAEYAWHGACSLIPLKVQPHYNPDGWLVPIVDGRMTYDLSSDENLDTLLPNLIRDIGNRGRARVIEHFDALLAASSSSLPKPQDVATQTADCTDSLSTWSYEDVHRWLRSRELSHIIDRLKHVNGELLIEIKKMRKDAPETFYSTIKSELKLNFVSLLRFTKALDDLDHL